MEKLRQQSLSQKFPERATLKLLSPSSPWNNCHVKLSFSSSPPFPRTPWEKSCQVQVPERTTLKLLSPKFLMEQLPCKVGCCCCRCCCSLPPPFSAHAFGKKLSSPKFPERTTSKLLSPRFLMEQLPCKVVVVVLSPLPYPRTPLVKSCKVQSSQRKQF